MDSEEQPKEISVNEKRIRQITFIYYSRADVRRALFDFSQNRECVPRYFEGFGKRPDSFQYDSDILSFVNKGATSFHCSEELWRDPLEISTDLKDDEIKDLRIGWDLLLDVDSKYLDYSKIYTELLIETLKAHGIKNIGVKFSGSKGFHILVPWKAFPKEIYGQKTKDMFPELPRLICKYLSSCIRDKLANRILEQENFGDLAKKIGTKEEELLITECLGCHRQTSKKELVTWICPGCKNELVMIRKNKRIPKCPNDNCRKPMQEKLSKSIHSCDFCSKDSNRNPENFSKTRTKTEQFIDADLVLVSPRHLFRMPYSLHEKTSLCSVVLDKNNIKTFQIQDASPFKVSVRNFMPDSVEGEAKELLLKALGWQEQNDKVEISMQENNYPKNNEGVDKQKSEDKSKYQEVIIKNLNESLYPPCIRLILNGIKDDGRKRALFILINFFRALKVNSEELEKIIFSWNEKNSNPLEKSYIQAQLIWHKKNDIRLPPNCDKPNYKDLSVCRPDEICKTIKNPINYVFKKYFRKS
jgi:DNA primase catalytic subunit